VYNVSAHEKSVLVFLIIIIVTVIIRITITVGTYGADRNLKPSWEPAIVYSRQLKLPRVYAGSLERGRILYSLLARERRIKRRKNREKWQRETAILSVWNPFKILIKILRISLPKEESLILPLKTLRKPVRTNSSSEFYALGKTLRHCLGKKWHWIFPGYVNDSVLEFCRVHRILSTCICILILAVLTGCVEIFFTLSSDTRHYKSIIWREGICLSSILVIM